MHQRVKPGFEESLTDWRNLDAGLKLYLEPGYVDQPYVVIADDGFWVMVITHSPGHEGEANQRVLCLRSSDQGRTWSDPVALETSPPQGGFEASYAVLLKAPTGRLFAFYNYNSKNMRSAIAGEHDPKDPSFRDGVCVRMDSLGDYVFRYSDDHGLTWSSQRYTVPVRAFEIDRENPYQGEIRFFWNVGKAFTDRNEAYVPLHKVGAFGYGFFSRSEGCLLHSPDLFIVEDVAQAKWQTLPEGDIGLRSPEGGGPIAEEQSFSSLGDGSFFVVYRTIEGHSACSYSRDRGKTWSRPDWMRYRDGRPIKNPRAANFAWRLSTGKWLYWFHNHSGRGYEDRNPVWVCGGEEILGAQGLEIRWSEPEILLYSDAWHHRMSYPDLIEDQGRVFITETQKVEARLHEIPSQFLELLCNQRKITSVAMDSLIQEWQNEDGLSGRVTVSDWPAFSHPPTGPMASSLPWKRDRNGLSLELVLELGNDTPAQLLVDGRCNDGSGMVIGTTDQASYYVSMSDSRQMVRWESDPGTLIINQQQHVGIVVDGAAGIITFTIDGKVNDGGEHRQFGFGRIPPNFRGLNQITQLDLAPTLVGQLKRLRVYGRSLLHTELVGNWRALNHKVEKNALPALANSSR